MSAIHCQTRTAYKTPAAKGLTEHHDKLARVQWSFIHCSHDSHMHPHHMMSMMHNDLLETKCGNCNLLPAAIILFVVGSMVVPRAYA